MVQLQLVPLQEYERVRNASLGAYERVSLLADMCRINTLNAVKLAGSGHLGSSFSAMEIVAWLYNEEMNTLAVGIDSPDRDIYFSSKGHDVPGLYSVLHSLGVLPEEKLRKLRRYGGLDGHPDVGVRAIESNSGSLGMGISKGRGMAWAKRRRGHQGRVFVLLGDGELQEGQNYEALQTTVHQGVSNLTVIVDHNKLQTDRLVSEITDLGELEGKFRTFGWQVARCDGHDLEQLDRALGELAGVNDRPKVLIADTIKGKGVSFMEHPQALKTGGGFYQWHAGAPDDESFSRANQELEKRVNSRLRDHGLEPLTLVDVTPPEAKSSLTGPKEYVADAYGEALLELGAEREDLVVLDGDLAADCRIRAFDESYPERFIENGIAEQDMVSMAGGLARHGLLPVVNTFASFLAARANEQIYNNATEGTKILYACHYAGLIPAGPGKSHQSVRDISLFAALPECTILQPANGRETAQALRYLVQEAEGVGVLRLVIGPSPRPIPLPADYVLTPGQGAILTDGGDAALIAYGPVMLHEALVAAERLERQGVELRVINMPWLNRTDATWVDEALAGIESVFVVEDHSPVGGLGDHLLHIMAETDRLEHRRIRIFGVAGNPACGTPEEALGHHGLDGASLARMVLRERGMTLTAIPDSEAPSLYTTEAPQ